MYGLDFCLKKNCTVCETFYTRYSLNSIIKPLKQIIIMKLMFICFQRLLVWVWLNEVKRSLDHVTGLYNLLKIISANIGKTSITRRKKSAGNVFKKAPKKSRLIMIYC